MWWRLSASSFSSIFHIMLFAFSSAWQWEVLEVAIQCPVKPSLSCICIEKAAPNKTKQIKDREEWMQWMVLLTYYSSFVAVSECFCLLNGLWNRNKQRGTNWGRCFSSTSIFELCSERPACQIAVTWGEQSLALKHQLHKLVTSSSHSQSLIVGYLQIVKRLLFSCLELGGLAWQNDKIVEEKNHKLHIYWLFHSWRSNKRNPNILSKWISEWFVESLGRSVCTKNATQYSPHKIV